MSDSSTAKLRDGELRFSSGANLTVELERNGAVSRVVLPMPMQGYGGHELVVAPDELHAALYLYSGQSEQGWELLALTPTLQQRVGKPIEIGEGTAPVFATDGSYVAMLTWVPQVVIEDGEPTDVGFDELYDPDSDARYLLAWARLHVQRISDGAVTAHQIIADIPVQLHPNDIEEWNTYDALRFVDANTLELTMPWGAKVSVAVPLAEPSAPIIAAYPNVE